MPNAGPFVLVVDDDPRILHALERIASSLPLRLRTATSAEEAAPLLDAEAPALVICDYRLPGLDGLTFLERVRTRFPQARLFLHTGEAVYRTAQELEFPVLGKPCPPDALREILSSALERTPR